MKQNSRLILKVKKKRASITTDKLYNNHVTKDNKENLIQKKSGIKRLNPFSHSDESATKKLHLSTIDNIPVDKIPADNIAVTKTTSLIHQLDIAEKKSFKKLSCSTHSLVNHTEDKRSGYSVDSTDVTEDDIKYESKEFPIDWSLKEKVKFISPMPMDVMKNNLKSVHETKGIRSFVSNSTEEFIFSENLYNWVHPNIPGMQRFPLRKKFTGTVLKEESTLSLLANNKPFQEILMLEWRKSFESLFSMLKTGYCPYFYLCSYQFTILFKAHSIGNDGMVAIVTPTTKGFRKMLSDEGITFEFPCGKLEYEALATNSNDEFEDKSNESLDSSLNNSNNDEAAFLDSIGLDKKSHFPNMIEQQRLKEKSKIRKFDNHLESTIQTKNCQGLFNFLLNSSFLCSPSGSTIGIPPTLLSPSPFQGGSLQKCKFSYGPIKYQKNGICNNQYCLEISGTILPTQLHGVIDTLAIQDRENAFIQCKSYDNLVALNFETSLQNTLTPEQLMKFGISETAGKYINQKYNEIPSNYEIRVQEGNFKL